MKNKKFGQNKSGGTLEEKLMALAMAQNRTAGVIQQLAGMQGDVSEKLGVLEQAVEAIVQIMGKDVVINKIRENMALVETARNTAAAKALEEDLANGSVQAVETVGENSKVVLKYDDSRTVTIPVGQLREPMRTNVVGKKLNQYIGTDAEGETDSETVTMVQIVGVYDAVSVDAAKAQA